MSTRATRALRGVAASAVATWTAAVSHTVGGGHAPSPLVLLIVTALAAPLCVALAGRALSLLRVIVAVGLSQVLLHVTFSATAGLDGIAGDGHVHGIPVLSAGATPEIGLEGPMVIAHILAAVLTVLAMYRGERMLHALGRGIRRVFVRMPPQPQPAIPRAVHSCVGGSRPRPRRRTDVHDLSRRGPPAFV
ncbi:hypothetical protein ACFQZV_11730 [Microbacterium koreense]|uniref:Integral membrane protein n=1 Tax=Microbacterium koreense TaxID=323761 RepID=A0ABW2ZTH1_9MICO